MDLKPRNWATTARPPITLFIRPGHRSGRFHLGMAGKGRICAMPKTIVHRVSGLLILVSLLIGTTWAAYALPQGAYPQATTSFTFTPVADAYVIQSHPSQNFGLSTTLRADASPVTRSYVRFIVNGLNGGATVQSAKVRFYVNSTSTTGFAVRTLSNNTWIESTITYSNSPFSEWGKVRLLSLPSSGQASPVTANTSTSCTITATCPKRAYANCGRESRAEFFSVLLSLPPRSALHPRSIRPGRARCPPA